MLKKYLCIIIFCFIIIGISSQIINAEKPWERYDFQGETITIGSQSGIGPFDEGEYLVWLEEVEDKFNVNIEFIEEADPEVIGSGILAGDPGADIYILRNRFYENLAAEGMLLSIDNILDNEYWERIPDLHRKNHEAYKFKDIYYSFPSGGILGYFNDFITEGVIFWNKEIFEREGLPNLYQLQEEDEWTWDVFLEIAKAATKDTDGDGEIDQWGFDTLWVNFGVFPLGVFLYSNNADFYQIKDGKVKVALSEPEAIEAIEFFQDLKFRHEVMYPEDNIPLKRREFFDGNIAMYYAPARLGTPAMRTLENQVGQVFFPRGPQGDRYTTAVEIFMGAIPITTEHDPRALIELINAVQKLTSEYRDSDKYIQDILDENYAFTVTTKESLNTYRKILKGNWDSIKNIGPIDISGFGRPIMSEGASVGATIDEYQISFQESYNEVFNQ